MQMLVKLKMELKLSKNKIALHYAYQQNVYNVYQGVFKKDRRKEKLVNKCLSIAAIKELLTGNIVCHRCYTVLNVTVNG